MRRKMIASLFFIGMVIMTVNLACGSASVVATPTPRPPIKTHTPAPTITPLPTYTPKPTPTKVSKFSPTATETPLGDTTPESVSVTSPNCVASTIPGYNTCVDDTGNITVDVPNYWTEFNGGTWTYNGRDIGVAISAAPNLSDFKDNNFFNVEGLFFGASGTFAQIIGHIELLDYYTMAYRGNCKYIGRFNYEDELYRGKYDEYTECGGKDGYDAYVLGAREKKEPSSILILIEMQVFPGDTATRDHIWTTFYVLF